MSDSSSLLISAERRDLENEFIEITAEEAARVADRIRWSTHEQVRAIVRPTVPLRSQPAARTGPTARGSTG